MSVEGNWCGDFPISGQGHRPAHEVISWSELRVDHGLVGNCCDYAGYLLTILFML
jgi:hypothetical protein